MKSQVQEVRNFFFSQHFEDGVRTTFAVLMPALLFSYLEDFATGLIISIGAFCVSLADSPGPIIHRKNSMLICAVIVFVVAVVTGFARLNGYTMGIAVLLFSFFFSMFNLYGNRAASVGNAALLIMVLTMDKTTAPDQVWFQAFHIFCGGLWYMLISLLVNKARPYRAAQRALGESIQELAVYLSIKSDFYNTATDLDEDYNRLVSQQVVVSEKQDAVRELIFKTRIIVQESTPMGRKLILAFIDSVDLFEDITATYYDYTSLRKKYGDSSVLKNIWVLTQQMADELNAIGIAIQTNKPYTQKPDFDYALGKIRNEIDALSRKESEVSNLVLIKILVILRKMVQRFKDILRYFDAATDERSKSTEKQHKLFVSHQSLDPKIFWSNLTLHSSVFRHSFRVSIACIVGFLIAKSIATGHYSYWILMTIVIMMKPAFSLTKKRNYERIVGTVAGGIIGVLILAFIPDKHIQFALLVLFMIITYSFLRVQYLIAVLFMTPFIFILFNFLGVGFLGLARERILDTIIGCFIALLAGYLLFPNWESEQLRNYLQKMLRANIRYFQKIGEGLAGKTIGTIDYRLVRKEVYVTSANLSAAFQRMLSEPKSKQKNKREIHQFVVLNHILFSNIASIASSVLFQQASVFSDENIRTAKKALQVLCGSLQKMEPDCTIAGMENLPSPDKQNEMSLSAEDVLLKEQLEFVYRLSLDIAKVTDSIISG